MVSEQELYLSTPLTILEVLSGQHRDLSKVMVLGHNPGMATLASILARQSMNMPTAAVAIFDVDDFTALHDPSISHYAPPSHLIGHLSTYEGCKLTHFASPKTL